jgi:tetratricopeptide (TPR) repeat protein
MTDQSRIDDLRRRVQKDPASIAFAQLAEECRRAGQYEEAVEVCRTGLAIHPGYLSAHVTLGRALIELDSLDDAQGELELVLRSAPENLAALRGLAEIHHRRKALPEALAQYRAALLLARNDPDLQRTVADLERIVEPPKPPAAEEGLSFAEVESEFLKNLPPPPPQPALPTKTPPPAVELGIKNSEFGIRDAEPLPPPPPALELGVENPEVGMPERIPDSKFQIPNSEVERERAVKTIAALEQWLDAIHVTRTNPVA